MNKVVWSVTALGHVRSIRTYLARFNPRAAGALAHGSIAAGDSLADFPLRSRPVPYTNMRELVTAWPYIIRYRVAGDTVRILRVRHAARAPTNH